MVIVKKTYKDQVIDHIYQMLLADQLKPGDRLKESLLALEMGISRAPIREALKELMTLGLIDYKPQIGNFLPVMTPKQIIDSYTTRGVLEGYAVMSASEHFTRQDLERLDRYVDVMGQAARDGEHKQVVDIGGEFHDFLVARSDNQQLLEYSSRLSMKLHVLFFKHWGMLYRPDEIEQRHRAIVTSIKAQDKTRIEQVVRNHYVETGTKIVAVQALSSVTVI
ncbi:MAG: GntR family transcriptional regulator [Desulfuromonadales bacterium]|nr:GntR family transcriptional regulator [Desulfuromonadales bacterium]